MRRIQFYKEANSSCANHALLAGASNCLTVAQKMCFYTLQLAMWLICQTHHQMLRQHQNTNYLPQDLHQSMSNRIDYSQLNSCCPPGAADSAWRHHI